MSWIPRFQGYTPRIRVFLQIYRLGVLLAIAWLVRAHHDRLRVEGDWPVTVSEVKVFLKEAHRLRIDPGPRAGLEVLDAAGERIGYAVRTMPEAREITGYSGPSDVLVVFDAEDKGLGVAIRHSYDTPSHVEDVRMDFLFMERWNGRSWDEIARITDLGEAGIYGVSGATRTSDAVAKGITHRLAAAEGRAGERRRLSFGWRDGVLLAFVVVGGLFALWKRKGFQRWRWVYSLATIAVLGLWLGDLIAQSLLVGWAENRVPWEAAPGVLLLVVAAFVVPWGTGQPLYCQFICPHGNLQRWAMKVLPATWKRPVSEEAKWAAKWVPPMLLAVVLVVSFLQLDFDLAGIEPFDAYLLTGAGRATIVVAVVGLVIALWIPMAYCRFGCPTGWVLEFVRRRLGKDRFSDRDWMGLFLLALAVAGYLVPARWVLG